MTNLLLSSSNMAAMTSHANEELIIAIDYLFIINNYPHCRWFSPVNETEGELTNLPIVHWGRHFYGPVGSMLDNNGCSKVFFDDKTWLLKNNATLGGYVIHADVYVNCIQTIGLSVVIQDGGK
jgi:hypothetical protein